MKGGYKTNDFREVFQKDFDEDDLNRLELKIETRAKIKEMLVDTKKEKNTIVRYLSYAKGCQAQKGNVHLYDINYITFRNFCYYCKEQYNEHIKDGSRLKKEDKNIQLWLEFLHQISIPSEIFDLSHRYMKNVSSR